MESLDVLHPRHEAFFIVPWSGRLFFYEIERPETIELGTNVLVGTNPKNIQPYLEILFAGDWKKGCDIPLWDGHAAVRIVKVITSLKKLN